MPTLDWIGKRSVLNHHRDVPCLPLRGQRALSAGNPDAAGRDNLLIEGDNLLALKSLLPEYAERFDCIYTDPPYNTGSEGWVYNDNVNGPEVRQWLGRVIGAEAVDASRHDKWLCMMYPRIRLLIELLAPGGVLFVSIDDHEVHALRYLMEEVPGACFAGCIVWERKRKGSHLSRRLTRKTEYVLVYGKGTDRIELYGEPAGRDEDFPLIKRGNRPKELCVPRGVLAPTPLPDGAYGRGVYGSGGTAVRLLADVTVVEGSFRQDLHIHGPFVWTQAKLDEEVRSGARLFVRTHNFGLRALKAQARQGFKALSSLLTRRVGTNEDASAELSAILGTEVGKSFPFPKPHTLVKTLLASATRHRRSALVLDAFAGSGTTGHAVLALNHEDGGSRRFVLVERDRAVCRTVTAPRLRRVIEGYATGIPGLGGGFRYCTLG
jgi:hypothetical protein